MFVLRNLIIAALCLSFPSVFNAYCIEMAECVDGFSPNKGKCFIDYGYKNIREFYICCGPEQESPEYIGANYCTSKFGADEELTAEIKEAVANYTAVTYSAAPTVGAWTVTALGAVATTAAAFYGI